MDFAEIEQLVKQVAAEELMSRFHRVDSSRKADGSLITEADKAVQSRLIAELTQRWPDIAVLGEEMDPAEQQRVLDGADRLWCLDPLDGTTNFAAGLPYFAISLALIEGGRAVGGVVFDPNRNESFRAERGAGARLNGARLVLPEPAPTVLRDCIGLVDLKRLPPKLAFRLVTEAPFRSQRSFGAVALDWCWMAAGRCHVYLHGRQNIWDYAAGSLVFAEAGGAGCLTDGPAGACDPRLFLGSRSGVAAVSRELFALWRDYLAAEV